MVQIAAGHQGRFAELTATISRYWQIQGAHAPEGEQVVLVDLQHNDLNCLLTCLTGAKYLSLTSGAGLVGLIGQNATQRWGGSAADYDASNVRRLAEAFGVQVFVPADAASLLEFTGGRPEVQTAIRADLERFEQLWATAEDATRWSDVAAFRCADGLPIGLDVADSVGKVTGDPRPGVEATELTRALLLEALQVRAVGHWVCDTAPVAAYVTSHIGYASWATMAATVAARGGVVVHAESLANGSSYTFIEPGGPQAGRIADRRARQLADLFDEVLAVRTGAHDALRAKTATLLGSPFGPGGGWWAVDQASQVDRRPGSALRASALAKLDVEDRGQPVVYVLSHCLTDVPRQATNLYEDYHRWLHATLDLAVQLDDRTWVVRFHPWYRMYGEGPTVEAIKRRYAGHAHIRFDDGVLTKDEYFSSCDVGLTVRGTAALELGRWGIPVIVAGSSWYERAGFVHCPATVDAYERLLRLPPDQLPELPGSVDAALSFSAFTTLLLPLTGPLLPPLDPYPHTALMATLAARYRAATIELDPAFRAVARAWAGGATAAVNHDLLAVLHGAGPDVLEGPARAAGERDPAADALQRLLEGWRPVGAR